MISLFKQSLHRWLHQSGRAVIYRPQVISENPSSLLVPSLPMLIAEQTLRQPNLTIVQVGALDGQSDDPLNEFLRDHPARAVLFEPQPGPFERLCKTYAHRPTVTPVNAAITPQDGPQTLYTVADSRPGDPSWLAGIASFDKDVLLCHADSCPDLAQRIRPITVEGLSVATLRQRFQLDAIHVLVVDAEGFDWKIIQQFFAAGARPAVIAFEYKHLTPAEKPAALQTLIQSGYQVALIGPDVLAKRTGADGNGATSAK